MRTIPYPAAPPTRAGTVAGGPHLAPPCRGADAAAGRRAVLFCLLLLATLFAPGCSSLPPQKQRHLSKGAMRFSALLVHTDTAGVLAQIETGAALSGGAQASGCSSCR